MHQTNDAIWLSFEALAKTYPRDNGVRITADLARWLLQERQRLNPPVPPIIDKVVRKVKNARTVTKYPDAQVARPLRATLLTRR